MSPTAADAAIVTKSELEELAEWEKKNTKAKREAAVAEKELDYRRQALAEKVLGIKSSDDLKVMTPQQVEKAAARRLEAGHWKLERDAPEFSFANTNSGRYPAWSKLYAAKLGETAAKRIAAETPLTYSYRVEVSLS